MKSFLKKRGKSSETTPSGLLSKKVTQSNPRCKHKDETEKMIKSRAKPGKSTEKLIKCRLSKEMQGAKNKPEKVLRNILPNIKEFKKNSEQRKGSPEKKKMKSRENPMSLPLHRKCSSIRRQNLLKLIASNKNLTHFDEIEQKTPRTRSTEKKRGTSCSLDNKKNHVIEKIEGSECDASVKGPFLQLPPSSEDAQSSLIDSFVTAPDVGPDIMEICKVGSISTSVSNDKPSSKLMREMSVLKLSYQLEKDREKSDRNEGNECHNKESETAFLESYHKKQLPSTQYPNFKLNLFKGKSQDSTPSKIKISHSSIYLLDFLKGNNLPLNLEDRKRLVAETIESIAGIEPTCNGCKSNRMDNASNLALCLCSTVRSHAIHKPYVPKNDLLNDNNKIKRSEEISRMRTDKWNEFKREMNISKLDSTDFNLEIAKQEVTNKQTAVKLYQDYSLAGSRPLMVMGVEDCLINEMQKNQQSKSYQKRLKAESLQRLENVHIEATSEGCKTPINSLNKPLSHYQDEENQPRKFKANHRTDLNYVDVPAEKLEEKIGKSAKQNIEKRGLKNSEETHSRPSDSFKNDSCGENPPDEPELQEPRITAPSQSIIIHNVKTCAHRCGSDVNIHQRQHNEVSNPNILINRAHARKSSEGESNLFPNASDIKRDSDNLQIFQLNENPIIEESEKELPSSYIIVYPDRNVNGSPQTLAEKALKLKADHLVSQFDQESQDTFLDEIKDICEEIINAKMQRLQKKLIVDVTSRSDSYVSYSSDRSSENSGSRKSRDSKISEESQETQTDDNNRSSKDSYDSKYSWITENSKNSRHTQRSYNTNNSTESQDSRCSQTIEDSKNGHDSQYSQCTRVSEASQDPEFSHCSRSIVMNYNSQETNTSEKRRSADKFKFKEVEMKNFDTVSMQKHDVKGSFEVFNKGKAEKKGKKGFTESQKATLDSDAKNQENGEITSENMPEKLTKTHCIGVATEKTETLTQTLVDHDTSLRKKHFKETTDATSNRVSKLKRKLSYDHWVTVSKHGKLRGNRFKDRNFSYELGNSKTADNFPENCDSNGDMFNALEMRSCDFFRKTNNTDGSESTESICEQPELPKSSKISTCLDLTRDSTNEKGKPFEMNLNSRSKLNETKLVNQINLEKNSDLFKKQQSIISCTLEPKNLIEGEVKESSERKDLQVCELKNKNHLCCEQKAEINMCKPEQKEITEKEAKRIFESIEMQARQKERSSTQHQIASDLLSHNRPNRLNSLSEKCTLTSQTPIIDESVILSADVGLPSEEQKNLDDLEDKKGIKAKKNWHHNRGFHVNAGQESKFFGAQVLYRRDSKQSILNTTEGMLKVPTSKDNSQNVMVLFEEVLSVPNHKKSLTNTQHRDLESFELQHVSKSTNTDGNYQHFPKNFDTKKKFPLFSTATSNPFKLQSLPPVTKRPNLRKKHKKLSTVRTSLVPYGGHYEAYKVTIPNEQHYVTKPYSAEISCVSSNQQKPSDDRFSYEIIEKLSKNSATQSSHILKCPIKEINFTRISNEKSHPIKLTMLLENKMKELIMSPSFQRELEPLNVKKSENASLQSFRKCQKADLEFCHQKLDSLSRGSTKYKNSLGPDKRKLAAGRRMKSDDNLISIESLSSTPVQSEQSLDVALKSSGRVKKSTEDICHRCGSYIEEFVRNSLENSTINSKDSDLIRFCETLHLKPVQSENECELCNAESSSIAFRKSNDSKFTIPSNVNIFNHTSQDVCFACEVAKLKEIRSSEIPAGICNTPEKKRKKRQDSKHTVHFHPSCILSHDESKSVNPVQSCTSFIYRRTENIDPSERCLVKVKSEPTTYIQRVNENGKQSRNHEKSLDPKTELSLTQFHISKRREAAMTVRPSFSCCPSLEKVNETNEKNTVTRATNRDKDAAMNSACINCA